MDEERAGGSKAAVIVLIVLGGILLLLLGWYFWRAAYYGKHFFPGTELNGIEVGGLTAEEAEDKLALEIADYLMTVNVDDEKKYQIMGPDIDYHYMAGTEVSDLLAAQDSFGWLFQPSGKKEETLHVSAKYDETKLRQQVSGFDCFLTENVIQPQNAYLSETEDGYEIVPEEKGTALNEEAVYAYIKDGVDAGQTELTLPDSVYQLPEVTSDDPRLQECLSKINSYLDTKIEYDVGEEGEVLDRKTTKHWITVSDTYEVTFDESKITDYVQYLATKYNTYGAVRKFKTALGDTLEVSGGDYGWVIDKDKEIAQLKTEINTGKTIKREPIYSQKGLVKSASYDLPDTYVEVDYTNQHLYYFENGELKLDSDVVTGNINRNNGSPDGIYKIIYKQSPATLVGEGYQSDVKYFMVFAYNVGFHDASWRSQFGGQIYKSSGSHGCVNMPEEKAAELYSMLETDTPVITYYREPVVLTADNARYSNAASYKAR